MKKIITLMLPLTLFLCMCASAQTEHEEAYVDEGKGEIVEDKPDAEFIPEDDSTLLVKDDAVLKNRSIVFIKRYFKDDSTFVIICKGFPKEGLPERDAVESAKEAALINAQMLGQQMFDVSVDVIRRGTVKKREVHDDFVVIKYQINHPGLKGKLRSGQTYDER